MPDRDRRGRPLAPGQTQPGARPARSRVTQRPRRAGTRGGDVGQSSRRRSSAGSGGSPAAPGRLGVERIGGRAGEGLVSAKVAWTLASRSTSSPASTSPRRATRPRSRRRSPRRDGRLQEQCVNPVRTRGGRRQARVERRPRTCRVAEQVEVFGRVDAAPEQVAESSAGVLVSAGWAAPRRDFPAAGRTRGSVQRSRDRDDGSTEPSAACRACSSGSVREAASRRWRARRASAVRSSYGMDAMSGWVNRMRAPPPRRSR